MPLFKKSSLSPRISQHNQSVKRIRGSSMTEVLIASIGFILFTLGATQVALNYKAKALVNSATFQAARIGAMNHGQKDSMEGELGNQLMMLYGSTLEQVDMQRSIRKARVDLAKPVMPGPPVWGWFEN